MSLNRQIIGEIEDFKVFVKSVGSIPATEFDTEFHGRLWSIEKLSRNDPQNRKTLIEEFMASTTPELQAGLMINHCRTKLLGYAGDHVIIDMIYQQAVADSDAGKLLDEFFHRQKAPTAVRNRKDFFIDTFAELCKKNRRRRCLISPAAPAGMLPRLLPVLESLQKELSSIASIWTRVR